MRPKKKKKKKKSLDTGLDPLFFQGWSLFFQSAASKRLFGDDVGIGIVWSSFMKPVFPIDPLKDKQTIAPCSDRNDPSRESFLEYTEGLFESFVGAASPCIWIRVVVGLAFLW